MSTHEALPFGEPATAPVGTPGTAAVVCSVYVDDEVTATGPVGFGGVPAAGVLLEHALNMSPSALTLESKPTILFKFWILHTR
jgi:hypothetical protein